MSFSSGSSDSADIAEIKQRYKNSLPDKAGELMQCIVALNLGNNIEHDLQQTHAFLHRFAGSSGMYGYDDLSMCCQLAIEGIQTKDLVEVLARLHQLRQLLESYA